jgi:Omp85 superfamily domain
MLLLLSLCSSAAAAEPAPVPPPPDPAAGERRDGRTVDPSKAHERALAVPRALLAPFRYLFKLIGWSVKPGADFDEHHHVHERVYNLTTSPDGLIGIRPVLNYQTRYIPEFGLRYFDHRTLGPDSRFELGFATFGSKYFNALLRAEPTWGPSRLRLIVDADFDRRFDYLFTGIGNSVHTPNPPSRYAQTAYAFGAGLRWHAPDWLTFNFGVAGIVKRFGNGDRVSGDPGIDFVYDTSTVPGFNNGLQFMRLTSSLELDTRGRRPEPYNGFLIAAYVDYSHGLGSDRSNYFRIRGALDIPISLWRGTHVLVLHAATEMVAQVGDVPVPFSELAVLGGPNDLRGFNIDDFRDSSSLWMSGEYRWPIWMWIDALWFVDYGGVFGPWFQEFSTRRMQPDVGFGVRIHTSGRFYFRAHLAYGFGEGWAFYVSGNAL